jgi:uncharacterized protein (TIGR00251 family)
MFYLWQDEGLILNCRIQPRAGTDSFDAADEELLKIRLKAAPVDGKANAHLIKFLSRQFRTPQRSIEILSGHTGRNKRVRIDSPGRLPPELPIERP